MLIVTIHNDGTGDEATADYDWVVSINRTQLAAGRVEGYDRARGWRQLIREVVDHAFADAEAEQPVYDV